MLDQINQDIREFSESSRAGYSAKPIRNSLLEFTHYNSVGYPFLMQKHIGNRRFSECCVCASKIGYPCVSRMPVFVPSRRKFSSFLGERERERERENRYNIYIYGKKVKLFWKKLNYFEFKISTIVEGGELRNDRNKQIR